MSSQSQRDANARDYARLLAEREDSQKLTPMELARLNSLPVSELRKINGVEETMEALANAQANLEITRQAGTLNQGLNTQYSTYVRASGKIAIAADMMGKQFVNQALAYGRNIEGAGRLVNKRPPMPLAQQVLIVIVALFALSGAFSLAVNQKYGAFLASAPYGLPNWMIFAAVAAIAFLYLRNRQAGA